MNSRAEAAEILFAVMEEGVSLSEAISSTLPDKALIQQICYGCLRSYFSLSAILKSLLTKPLKKKERMVHYLLLIGLYQIREMNIPDHAAVGETVAAAHALNKSWAKGLVNAVLRNYLRQKDNLKLSQTDEIVFNHPQWFIERLKKAWPQQWQAILTANNQRAPFCLRVNRREITREDYLVLLQQQDIKASPHPTLESAIVLDKPCNVLSLPGFANGLVSVQDAAAQYCGFILPLKNTDHVLDACAAPGGKACHLLERFDNLQLTAIDISDTRNQRTQENLSRLNLSANVLAADAADIKDWWDEKSFDGILLDAPCSATGVIRRHPDIKFLRRETDFKTLADTQLNLLQRLWQTLKPGGHLLYATCSIMPEENDDVIANFLKTQANAKLITLQLKAGQATHYGWQILPGEDNMDGFYYCLLQQMTEPQ